MKTFFFKIVFPAFALILAITASLAFKSNTLFSPIAYYNDDNSQKCEAITPPVDCDTPITGILCSVNIFGQTNNPRHIYMTKTPGNECIFVLFRQP
ncbi:DUF6520 family protein [Flavivirga rizhaonensis]|uniref:Secreted protein n=1 Tax=Flavivirga rizhaonensis TaxID=2559571 RepID=A0A4S1DVZ2_9FLAO|nr:DUF6520 family protein [Flavivirga rizhaonensis]TGV02179.1 hypothetical protein EM932_12495 [Flavivirga rizhaonensis]